MCQIFLHGCCTCDPLLLEPMQCVIKINVPLQPDINHHHTNLPHHFHDPDAPVVPLPFQEEDYHGPGVPIPTRTKYSPALTPLVFWYFTHTIPCHRLTVCPPFYPISCLETLLTDKGSPLSVLHQFLPYLCRPQSLRRSLLGSFWTPNPHTFHRSDLRSGQAGQEFPSNTRI